MLEMLQTTKARYRVDLKKLLCELNPPSNIQDVETGIYNYEIDIVETWKKAYVVANEIDHIDYLLLRESYKARTAFLYFLSAFLFCSLKSMNSSKNDDENMIFDFLFSFIHVIILEHCHRQLLSSNAPMCTLFVFKFYRNKVANVFEKTLINNYKLQTTTGVYPAMLTSTISRYFKRNQELMNGLSVNKWQIQKQIFWNTFYSYFKMSSEIPPEIIRLHQVYIHFHSGKIMNVFHSLKEPFVDQHLQSISDRLMSQVLHLLSIRLIGSTTQEQKDFFKLMRHCARHDMDTPEFHYASFFLLFPNSKTIPIDWESEQNNFSKNITACTLEKTQYQNIIDKLSSIMTSEMNQPRKISRKSYCVFFRNTQAKTPRYNKDESELIMLSNKMN